VPAQDFFNLLFQSPVLLWKQVAVIEVRSGDAGAFGECCFRDGTPAAQLFFWVADSFMVISPTSSSNALFSFFSFATSSHEGVCVTPFVSQP
jgi:hypothetical protein